MKKKLIILLIISTLLTYFIYHKNYKYTLNIMSINTSTRENDYNLYLNNLYKNTNINYIIDFSDSSYEIENLVGIIENNKNNIKEKLHKSNVIILSIGNIDYKTESMSSIVKELKELFTLLRDYNNKKIIYITPTNIDNIELIRLTCKKYNIEVINGKSYKNNPKKLATTIYRIINNSYKLRKSNWFI